MGIIKIVVELKLNCLLRVVFEFHSIVFVVCVGYMFVFVVVAENCECLDKILVFICLN